MRALNHTNFAKLNIIYTKFNKIRYNSIKFVKGNFYEKIFFINNINSLFIFLLRKQIPWNMLQQFNKPKKVRPN